MYNNMLYIIIYMMKTKFSLKIYNTAIGYVGFKSYIFMWRAKANYIACNLIEHNHYGNSQH